MNRILYVIIPFISAFIAITRLQAQTYYQVTHLTGTQTIGGNNVTVTPVGNVYNSSTICGAGPYGIGLFSGPIPAPNDGGYRFSFSTPINRIRARFTAFHNSESYNVYINGVQYIVTSGNLSTHTVCGTYPLPSIVSGTVINANPLPFPSIDCQHQLDILSLTPIDSIRIHRLQAISGGACIHDFYFTYDTLAFIAQPYTDTLKCPSDSLHLAYTTTPVFAAGNVFTVQLSDAFGSFTTPVNIGTAMATGGGIIHCKLPSVVTGNGYRVRIISSSPVRISADNGVNIKVVTTIGSVSAASNSPICEGSTLNLFASNGPAGTTYGWTGLGSYASALQNPSVTNALPANSGDYVVTANLNGCIAKDTVTVQVKPLPAVPVASNSGPVCEGSTLNFTSGSATSGVTYNWTGPASFSSSLQNPVINNTTLSNSGVYNVTASLNGCTSAAGSTTATVKLMPAVPAASNNTPICAGADLNLTTISATSGVTYSWTGPSGFTSALQNPTIPAATTAYAGAYNVTATLNGCTSAAASTTATINIVSSIGGWVSPNDTVCEGTLATFVVVPSNAGPSPQYQWYKNGQPISGANIPLLTTLNIATGDSFYCQMIAAGVCTNTLTLYSNGIKMIVLPIVTTPVAHISSNPTPAQPGQSINFHATVTNGGYTPQYQWQRNGVNVLGAIYANWSAGNLAPYDKINCIVTSNDPCATNKTAYSDTITINFPTAVNSVNAIRSIELYPNPNNGSFTLKGIPEKEEATLEVVNMIGKVVYREVLAAQNNRQVTLPAGISNGLYIVRLSSGKKLSNFRMIVYR